MRNILIALFVLTLVALAIPAMAENDNSDNSVSVAQVIDLTLFEGEPEKLVDVAINLAWWPKYYGSNRSVFYDGEVWQPDVTFTSSRLPGWSLNAWASVGGDNDFLSFGRRDGGDFDDEIDITVGKSGSFIGFDYNANVAYFRVNVVPADVLSPFVEISRTVEFSNWTLTPYVKGEYYFPMHGQEPGNGTIARIGARSEISIGDRWTFSPWLATFYDTGAFGSDNGWLLEGGGEVVRKITPALSLGVPVKCGYPTERLEDDREPKCVAGLNLKF